MIVFLLLGVIWAAVLLPPWLQSRREAQPTASIRSFHRQLWLLGRTSPARGLAGAPGPRALSGRAAGPRRANGSGLVYGGAAYDPYVGYDSYGDGYADEPYAGYGDVDEAEAVPVGGRGRLGDGVNPRWTEPGARMPGYRRRRRVLATLAVAALATVVPALLAGGTGWIVHVSVDALLVAYVVLLVQRQRRTFEREEKVHYLAPIRAPRPAVVVLHGGAAR